MSESTPATSSCDPEVWSDAKASSTMTEGLKTLDLSDRAQMTMIDRLRELRVNAYVDLPKLVVVGDQSSGKSSVLEAIMNFPFPRGKGLCTSFATNIILRRCATTSVSISIIAGEASDSSRKKEFDSFNESYKNEEIENLDEARFQDILNQASRAMGVIGKGEKLTPDKRTFSKDVLVVELQGPDHDNLSIIDVPGIFRVATKERTTEADIELVKEMVNDYIKDDNTIILAVLPAYIDLENQEILSMAKKVDPKGRRTLGVLTKPDLMDKGGGEDIVDLFDGKGYSLALGYCIVRNHGQEEIGESAAHRTENECKFFLSSPWNMIDKDRVGIQSLKTRLRDLLSNMIKREFPKLRQQIGNRLKIAQTNLKKLGSDRQSSDEQRRFLVGIADKFQAIRSATMNEKYDAHDVLKNDKDLRLPTLLAQEFGQLSRSFRQHGHMVKFIDAEDSDFESQDEDETNSPPVDESSTSSDSQNGIDYGSPIENRLCDERYCELEDITIEAPYQSGLTEADAKKWIKKEYLANRGFHARAMNGNIFPLLFRTQTQSWLALAEKFIKKVIFLVHRYIHRLLKSLCGDGRTMEKLLHLLQDDILKRYRIALDRVELIIKIERHNPPITKNHSFEDDLTKIKSQHTEDEDPKEVDYQGSNGNNSRSDQFKSSQTRKSKIPLEADEIHSTLMVYHKLARKRVVDNICQNADYFLLTGENSPLGVLTPDYISLLTNDKLEQIAGEDAARKNKRAALNIEIERLEKAMKIIKG